MRRLVAAVGCAALLGVAAGALEAQASAGAQVRVGAQGSWGSDDTNFGVGGRVVVGLRSLIPTPGWEGVASFDYFLPDEPAGVDVIYWEINGNLAYAIPNVRGNLGPYVGGGLNVAHASAESGGVSASETEVGVNLLGGVKFRSRTSRLTPFAELRVELGGGDIVVLSGGVVF